MGDLSEDSDSMSSWDGGKREQNFVAARRQNIYLPTYLFDLLC